jgi:hypothetical protein
LYASTSIVRVINSRMMRWAGHEARMGEYWLVSLNQRDHPEVLEVDGDNIKMDLK